MRKPKRYDKSVFQAFTLVLQFGLNILVPVCMMMALGIFLDKKLGTSWLTIVLFFVGAVAGAQNVYRMAKRIYDKPGAAKTSELKEPENLDEIDRHSKEIE